MNENELIPDEELEQESTEETVEEELETIEEPEEEDFSPAPAPVTNPDAVPDWLQKLAAAQVQQAPEPEDDEDTYLTPKEIMARVEAKMEQKYGGEIARLKDQAEKPKAVREFVAATGMAVADAEEFLSDMSAQDVAYLMRSPKFVGKLKTITKPTKATKPVPTTKQSVATTAKPKVASISSDDAGVLAYYAERFGKNSDEYKARYKDIVKGAK